MKVKAALLKFVIGELFIDQTQSLLTAIEGLNMSAITAPLNQALADLATAKTEGDALKASNAALTADAVTKQAALDAAAAQVTTLQADLAAATAAASDPADAALVAQLAQGLADLKATLAP